MEENNENVKKSNREIYTFQPFDRDISILDFTSSKIKPVEKIKPFSFESTKSKKRQARLKINLNNIIDYKACTSKQVKGKIDDPQMQTTSNMSCDQEDGSKNLPSNTKIAYVCPLCFKNFKDNNSRIFHLKNCATKNKVSMTKLLKAMELQERQTAERISLGLPGAPILQNKKQTSIRKMAINQDSQLQLAIALSKSLYEVKKNKNSSQTEQDFIISSTKHPMENVTSRMQKKQNISTLQIRSQEERDRLLTEKIAEILVDSERLIQRQQQAKNENENRKKDSLKSHTLKKLLNFDNQLWSAAMLQLSQTDFFVKDLSPYVIPSEQTQEFMENINESNIMKKLQQSDKLAITHDSHLNKKESSNMEYEKHGIDIKLFEDMKTKNIKQLCINSLIVDWGNALNNSSSSDVIIFVNEDKKIWVHKLVFHVRCPNILLDIIPNENTVYSVKEKICWTDVEHYIALAFLEFIYCGIIEKYPILSNDTVATSSLRCLARRYKVKELFHYLRHTHVISHDSTSMDNKFEIDEQGIEEIYYINGEQNKLTLIPDRDSNTVTCSNQNTSVITATDVPHNQFLKIKMLSPEKCTIPSSHMDRENSISPDIFDDIDNITLNHSDNTKLIHIENSTNNIEHDLSSPNQRNLKNVTLNQLLSPSLTNNNKNSADEYTLMKSIMVTSRINQTKEIPDKMTDKVKFKSDLTLFIEEVQKENNKSDSEVDSEIASLSKFFIQNNKNPFKKPEHTESSIILDTFDNNEYSPKVSHLSKLESDMQIYAIKNPQLCNITIDENLKFITSANHNRTDLSSPITEVNIDIACNNKTLEKSLQENNVSMTMSYCSSSEVDTDDANISKYTKYKRKHINNSIAKNQSAVRKHKNIIEIESDKSKNNEIITSDCASNFISLTHAKNNYLNIPSLSNIHMDESISIVQMDKNTSNLEFLRKSRNETEICNALEDNISRSTRCSKMHELGNLNDEKLIISCNNNSLKTQISSDESSHNDCSNKSPAYSNAILISSSPHMDGNSADSYNFSKYNDECVISSKIQIFDYESQHFFSSATSFSNVNIENNVISVTLGSSPLKICRKSRKSRKRSKSEGSLQNNHSVDKNYEICEFDNTVLRECNRRSNIKSNVMNGLLTITESSDFSSSNYDVMDTPQLHREMKKYGLKMQNRKKSIKLLTYIYNELHPTISSFGTLDENVENVKNEDEEPVIKKQKSHAHLLNKYNIVKYNGNTSPLKILDFKDYSKGAKTTVIANASIENEIALMDCVNITEAFSKLLSFNKDLYNSILRYEPLNIELIHCMLKNGGFKCNRKALTDFLDEQCITFRTSENKTKIRDRKIHSRLK